MAGHICETNTLADWSIHTNRLIGLNNPEYYGGRGKFLYEQERAVGGRIAAQLKPC